jgi:hypothetical protein
MNSEQAFEQELEIFRKNCESAAQFFYGQLTINEVASRRPAVHSFLNQNAMFWNTAAGAMQVATFMAIGRSFDQHSPHNVDRLLKLAQADPGMFARQSLRTRKQGGAPAAPSWLDDFMRDVYVPVHADFRRLRGHVKKHRRIYESNYRELRHKVFAHTETTDEADIELLFSKTNKREMERLLLFLMRLYESMWHLFANGRKPTLRPLPPSVNRSGRLTLPRTSLSGVHRKMTHETQDLLVRAASHLAKARPRRRPTPHKGGQSLAHRPAPVLSQR